MWPAEHALATVILTRTAASHDLTQQLIIRDSEQDLRSMDAFDDDDFEVSVRSIVDTSTVPSTANFLKNHVHANVPLVLRGAPVGEWNALSWSAAGLAAAHGNNMVRVAPQHVNGPRAYLNSWLELAEDWKHTEPDPVHVDPELLLTVAAERVQMPLASFMEQLDCADPTADAAVAYYADGAGNLDHSFPFLRNDFAPLPFVDKLDLKRVVIRCGSQPPTILLKPSWRLPRTFQLLFQTRDADREYPGLISPFAGFVARREDDIPHAL